LAVAPTHGSMQVQGGAISKLHFKGTTISCHPRRHYVRRQVQTLHRRASSIAIIPTSIYACLLRLMCLLVASYPRMIHAQSIQEIKQYEERSRKK
jgi:hypothetical protein